MGDNFGGWEVMGWGWWVQVEVFLRSKSKKNGIRRRFCACPLREEPFCERNGWSWSCGTSVSRVSLQFLKMRRGQKTRSSTILQHNYLVGVVSHGLLMAVLAHVNTVCSNQKVSTGWEASKWYGLEGKQSTRMYKLVHYFFFTSLTLTWRAQITNSTFLFCRKRARPFAP